MVQGLRFNLLGAGTVGKLALSDINPAVEENIKKTVKENKISKLVSHFTYQMDLKI